MTVASTRVRTVSTAWGGIASWVSVQVRGPRRSCGQHQTRLTQHSTTGLPAIGRGPPRSDADPSGSPPPRSPGSPRAPAGSRSDFQLAAGIGRSEHLEPGRTEHLGQHRIRLPGHRVGSLCAHLGPSLDRRDPFAVITGRQGPQARVQRTFDGACRRPLPSFMTTSRQSSRTSCDDPPARTIKGGASSLRAGREAFRYR